MDLVGLQTMKKNLLEWIVFGVSVAVIVTVAGLLLREHFTAGNRPAEIVLTVGQAVAAGQRYAVPIEVRNSGDTAAEDVQVSVTLQTPEPEKSDVTIPYVPSRSTRRGWVLFSRDPGTTRLEARVLGYREP